MGRALLASALALIAAGLTGIATGLTAGAAPQSAPQALVEPNPSSPSASEPELGSPRIHRVYLPGVDSPGSESAPVFGAGLANPLANMTYHGAPVMTSMVAYTIFWIPPGRYVSPSYQSLVNRYFQDIGGTSFYNIVTQYYQEPPRQYIQNASTFGGTWVDTSPYPNAQLGFDFLYESDLQQEVQKAIATNHWPTGYNVMFFVYTARGAESCFNDLSACTPGEAHALGQTGGYCAYHTAYGTVAQPVIWANMPYGATWTGMPGVGQCTTQTQFPNDADSDTVISTTSHEHFEAVTDPVAYNDGSGTHYGWTDTDGGSGEIGDKCAYRYGTVGSDGGNVTLNGHRYGVQQEWSNAAFTGASYSGCVLSYNPQRFHVRGDFDGDGKADPGVFRPSTGQWITLNSGSNYSTYQVTTWGASGDMQLSGDFDGDGKQDLVIYRPSNGTWYILKSSTNFSSWIVVQWGAAGDVPVMGDWDGDGKTDMTVYRPSNGYWLILKSSTNFSSWIVQQWGAAGDVPVSGDYDGDGKTDITVFRPSNGYWLILKSSTNFTSWLVVQWGLSGDMPVSGDYDGDGKTDITLFRPSTGYWLILKSSTNFTSYAVFQWGVNGDTPVPGDFDGDGKTDPAIYRPSTGYWIITKSSTNYSTYSIFQWGAGGDLPVVPDGFPGP